MRRSARGEVGALCRFDHPNQPGDQSLEA